MQWYTFWFKKKKKKNIVWKDFCCLNVQRPIFDKTRKFIFCKYLNYASYVKGFQNKCDKITAFDICWLDISYYCNSF